MTIAIRFLKPSHLALLILAGSTFALGGAWFIELVLGVKPCHLCLIGRMPHYVGIPLAFLAVIWNHGDGASRLSGRLAFAALFFVFLAGSAIALYHTGVEFRIFQGPTDCTGPIEKPAAIQDFLKQLETVKVVKCDEVAMRIFGLSLAAWNAVISFALMLAAAMGAARSRA
jgi:disulfide bond formation protein DsbB